MNALVIEVADTTLAYDRRIKVPRYARAGIPEVWLFDIADATRPAILVHRQPSPDGFLEVIQFTRGDVLSIVALPDLHLPADRLLI